MLVHLPSTARPPPTPNHLAAPPPNHPTDLTQVNPESGLFDAFAIFNLWSSWNQEVKETEMSFPCRRNFAPPGASRSFAHLFFWRALKQKNILYKEKRIEFFINYKMRLCLNLWRQLPVACPLKTSHILGEKQSKNKWSNIVNSECV